MITLSFTGATLRNVRHLGSRTAQELHLNIAATRDCRWLTEKRVKFSSSQLLRSSVPHEVSATDRTLTCTLPISPLFQSCSTYMPRWAIILTPTILLGMLDFICCIEKEKADDVLGSFMAAIV